MALDRTVSPRHHSGEWEEHPDPAGATPNRGTAMSILFVSPDPRLRPVRAALRAGVSLATIGLAAFAGLLV